MKVTDTRKTEKILVNLYHCSRAKEHNEDYILANNLLKFIMFCFEIISVFTSVDHAKIVKTLYFNKDNIFVMGIRNIQQVVFVQERTLLLYRKKYCEVVNAIFVLVEEFDFI